ncbi:SWIM zinc finger domain-containing protein [Rhodococcus sp. USK10]|uniref:SWIM zinc finger family protein n=1 Tax=Rhodococcus sp. USK10 TaxID=2789739 RepID=UPI001C603A82|nr:SWIM zinc finger family protein [Rhodococcus sp. USK10]QYB05900.1 SWIM zinc finger domain-containing protein [Rhodococcus sp. USK10]
MTSPWSEGQVASVAPDAGSLAAAAKLSGAWSQTGGNGDALWGQCQGSGKSPYRSVVDLTGPEYHCSCPSRKFPCKHALGLLLIWSQGRVPEQSEPPEFANDWLSRRAGRATAVRTAAAPVTTASGAKTAERRAERVAAGLDELDLWLTDQIRSGLGAADISASAFDAIAARMVDAQAPGVASTLRRLPIVVATRADWPDRLLREYARLHLLVVAHRRLSELPEPLQASVRSHVGYPVATDSVRGEPGVRDRWMVLGMQTTEEKRLFTRKVWLLGRDHGRRAILLDFTHGSAHFSTVIPPLGSLVDATLHFYPGAAPLRAQFGDTHETPEPFTTVAPSDIDTALDDFAAAVGADPWIRSWPALLTGVTPAYDDGSWFVVDGQGRALPLSGEDPVLWRLLGMSGGSPVTVFGEWTSDSLVPVSVFDRGDVYPLVSGTPSTAGSRR